MKLSEIIIKQNKNELAITVPAGYKKMSCIHFPQDSHNHKVVITIEQNAQALFCETQMRNIDIEIQSGAQVNFVSLTDKQTAANVTKKFTLHDKAIARIFTGLFNSADITIAGNIKGKNCVLANHLLYFGNNKQKNNIIFTASHQAARGMSRSIVRGVALGDACVNFAGTIQIDQGAGSTNAHLEHEGLLLGSKAHINTLPKLKINTDNVRATHSSAVHNISTDQLFYLQSRGLDENLTKKMIIGGFLDEMLFIVQEESMIQKIRGMIDEKLKTISYE